MRFAIIFAAILISPVKANTFSDSEIERFGLIFVLAISLLMDTIELSKKK